MIGKWNYENYTKAIIPLLLAVGRFVQGWIESGQLERGELSDVVGLIIVAAIVFLAPNVKRDSAGRQIITSEAGDPRTVTRRRGE